VPVWEQLGKPKLTESLCYYKSATNHNLPVMGDFKGKKENPETGIAEDINYTVTKMPDLNLLGQDAIRTLGISLDDILQKGLSMKSIKKETSEAPDKQLQSECHKLCDQFPDLFKNELGCVKDF
jgi:hypothetical protein